jgi:hypothetical protein
MLRNATAAFKDNIGIAYTLSRSNHPNFPRYADSLFGFIEKRLKRI